MSKIAILSDIHGNLPALEKVIADMQARAVQRVFCLGDLISGPLWARETLEFLMRQNWTFIRGNHDRNLVERSPETMAKSDAQAFQSLEKRHLEWLAALPATLEVDETFLLCHGSPTNDRSYLLETIENGRVRLSSPAEIKSSLGEVCLPLVLCGHSHLPRHICLEDGPTLINPGSVGLPAYDDDSQGYFVVENGSPHARYAVIEQTPAGWKTEIILVPYDHEKAAAKARAMQRPDYVVGLLTGYMFQPE